MENEYIEFEIDHGTRDIIKYRIFKGTGVLQVYSDLIEGFEEIDIEMIKSRPYEGDDRLIRYVKLHRYSAT